MKYQNFIGEEAVLNFLKRSMPNSPGSISVLMVVNQRLKLVNGD